MSDQLSFTLKFSYDYRRKKTRLHLDFTPEYSTALNGRTLLPPFNPRKLRDALRFIEADLIPRIVEHMMREDLEKATRSDWKARKKALLKLKPALEKLDQLETTIASEGLAMKRSAKTANRKDLRSLQKEIDDHTKVLERFDKRIRPKVEKLIKNWKEDYDLRLNSIAFEQMSAGQASYNIQRIANTDVPPPRPQL